MDNALMKDLVAASKPSVSNTALTPQQLKQLARRPLKVSFAKSPDEVAEAQHLRYKVFAEEMGAQLPDYNGLDIDGFDYYCEHLLVRDVETYQVICTYRILSPERCDEAGGYYAAGEFDLSRLEHLFDRTVEVGRACVHKNYRNGGTITMLWGGLAKYMQMHNYEYMIGCGSVNMTDGGHTAASLYHQIKETYLTTLKYSVFPPTPSPIATLRKDLQRSVPPLIKDNMSYRSYIFSVRFRCLYSIPL